MTTTSSAITTGSHKLHTIRITPGAWNELQLDCARLGYDGRGERWGIGRYLAAVFSVNQDVNDWKDARPWSLRQWDHRRLQIKHNTLWEYPVYEPRLRRHISEANLAAIRPVLELVRWNIGVCVFGSDVTRLQHVIEAIHMRCLLYRNEPPHADPKSQPRRRYGRKFEIVF